MHKYLGIIILLLGLFTESLAKINEISMNDESIWWKNAIIYHMNPQTSITRNNVQNIISMLTYLKENGFTTLWLNATLIDFTTLPQRFDSIDNFEKLLHEARNLDLKIIIDLIVPHTWFLKSANHIENYTNFYIRSHSKTKTNSLSNTNWLRPLTCKQFYANFSKGWQPLMNFHESHLIQAIDNAIIFWLNKGVNGFRIHHLTKYTSAKESYSLVHHWRNLLNRYNKKVYGPDAIIMISSDTHFKSFMEYYENDQGIRGAHIPLNFLLINNLNENSDARDFVFTIKKWLIYMPSQQVPNWLMCDYWTTFSISNQFQFDAMQMILYTLPGISIIYNGEECYKNPSYAKALLKRNSSDLLSNRQCISSQFGMENSTAYGLRIYLKKRLVIRQGNCELMVLNKWLFAIIRSLKSEHSIVTIINIGSAKQNLNLQYIFNDANNLHHIKVLFCSQRSFYTPNLRISPDANLTLMGHEGIVLQMELFESVSKKSLKAERRDLIKILIKSSNIVLVGMLFYKVWHNKWTKWNLYKENIW